MEEINSRKSTIDSKPLRWLIWGSFIIVFSIIPFFIFFPEFLDFKISRFLTLILISVHLSLLFFLLWPHNATIENIPYINLPVKIAGPIVLWLTIFILMNNAMPDEIQQDKLFELEKDDNTFRIPYYGTELVTDKEEKVVYVLIEDANNHQNLKYIYVKFPPGESTINAKLKFKGFKSYNIVLKRNNSNILKIKKLIRNE